MIDNGSQVILCDFPIHLDSYKGCSLNCAYCFTRRKGLTTAAKPCATTKELQTFIEGKRTQNTSWCDWNIPLHWGAMADPGAAL